MSPEQAKFKVKSLVVYPIKGAQGSVVRSTLFSAQGFSANRSFMLVTRAGTFVNQLNLPILNRLVPELVSGGIKLSVGRESKMAYLCDARMQRTFNLYGSTGPAYEFGDDVNAWLTAQLGEARTEDFGSPTSPLRLLRLGADFYRTKDGATRPYRNFADRFELSVHTDSAEQVLNKRIVARGGAVLPSGRANRFLTNLILETPAGWTSPTENPEDAFSLLRFPNDAVVAVGNMIRRCAVTLKDQEGEQNSPPSEPLSTLATYRKFDPGNKIEAQKLFPDGNGVYFASYAQMRKLGQGQVSVGDEVTVELRPQSEVELIVGSKK